jgi:hypothetical protein
MFFPERDVLDFQPAQFVQDIQAVITSGSTNINRELIERGYGVFRSDLGGPEQQAMHGRMSRLFGKYTEELFLEGDQSVANPMRYFPTPFHTKYAQERTALSQYIQQEAVGTHMRRWQRPRDRRRRHPHGSPAPSGPGHTGGHAEKTTPFFLPFLKTPPSRSAPSCPACKPIKPASCLIYIALPARLCSPMALWHEGCFSCPPPRDTVMRCCAEQRGEKRVITCVKRLMLIGRSLVQEDAEKTDRKDRILCVWGLEKETGSVKVLFQRRE